MRQLPNRLDLEVLRAQLLLLLKRRGEKADPGFEVWPWQNSNRFANFKNGKLSRDFIRIIKIG
jgi:hypothetical protein